MYVFASRGAVGGIRGAQRVGKEHVLSLMMRFYDPDSGAVLFDGVDMRNAKQASLRAQTAVVFQESFLFNTTIRENIALGPPRRRMKKSLRPRKRPRSTTLSRRCQKVTKTHVRASAAADFPGGQRQRIAIARAVLKDPAILVLDEATSALDAASEHAINQTLAQIARGRTMISVTHRLSSVVGMDRVLLLRARTTDGARFAYRTSRRRGPLCRPVAQAGRCAR